jgi:uncharacterized protein with HEPN domain
MAMRLQSCVGKTHKQIWQEFKELYPELPESMLREIHLRWVRAYSEVTR